MRAIYVTFIANGYADAERPVTHYPGDMRQEDAAYWYSLRHSEVDCPLCDHSEDAYPADCPACGGFGKAEGEPFEVWRYLFASEEEADDVYARITGAGDGYERAAVVTPLSGTRVVAWEPAWRECSPTSPTPRSMRSTHKSLLPHQQRVVDEHAEICVKLGALGKFLGTATFEALAHPEQSRLRRQLGVMQAYADILDERIRAFPEGSG